MIFSVFIDSAMEIVFVLNKFNFLSLINVCHSKLHGTHDSAMEIVFVLNKFNFLFLINVCHSKLHGTHYLLEICGMGSEGVNRRVRIQHIAIYFVHPPTHSPVHPYIL